jgi:hypothetical protein
VTMSEAQKLAALLLHLELHPAELKRYRTDEKIMRRELEHFGLSKKTIDVVLNKDLAEFGNLFSMLRKLVGFGAAMVRPRRRKNRAHN